MIICYFCNKEATEKMLGVKLCTKCKGKLDNLVDEKALDSLFNPEGGERPCALCISSSGVIGICSEHMEDIVLNDKMLSAIFDGEVIPKGTRCKLEYHVTRNQLGEVDILKWKVISRLKLINSKKADNL
jgi:hypothetical protein